MSADRPQPPPGAPPRAPVDSIDSVTRIGVLRPHDDEDEPTGRTYTGAKPTAPRNAATATPAPQNLATPPKPLTAPPPSARATPPSRTAPPASRAAPSSVGPFSTPYSTTASVKWSELEETVSEASAGVSSLDIGEITPALQPRLQPELTPRTLEKRHPKYGGGAPLFDAVVSDITTMPDRAAAMEQLEAQRTRSEKPPVPDGEEPTDLIRMPPKAQPSSTAPKAEPRPPAPVSRRTGEVLALRAAFDHDNSNSRSASQARRNAARDNDGSWLATVVVGLGLVVVGAAGALLLLPFMPPDVVARWMQVPLPTAAPSATTAPTSSAPVLAPTTRQRSADDATLAEAGDKEALKRLRERPARELTAREVAARLIGDAVRRRSELADLADGLGSRRTRANGTLFARAAADARDERTAPEALYVLANWPTTEGANELWAITEAREAPASAQAFAWELLVSRDVRGRASEPLRLAIELRELLEFPAADGACERARTALIRARDVADIRSLRLAGSFGQRRGCGAKGTSDCWPCLRGGREIREAMNAVSNRPAPSR